MPRLEILTRHLPTRSRALALQQASLAPLTALGLDWTQTLLVDDEARGLAYANTRLREVEPVGEWVWVLDDDDLLTAPKLLSWLVSQPGDLVITQFDHGTLGTLPPAAEDDWSRTLPPASRIGSPSVLVRAELWRLARAAWGPEYTGDHDFIAEAWRRAASRRWVPIVLGRVQRISKGSPTDIA